MHYDFDRVGERRGTDSVKWERYGEEVIPMWVADMDFPSAEPVVKALRERVEHAFFGYTHPRPELCEAVRERLNVLYSWKIQPDELFFLPGIVTGLNLFLQAFTEASEGVLVQPPVYPHFVHDPVHHGRALVDPPLVRQGDTYEIDFDLLRHSIRETTRVFILCNPHNPVGRVYTRKELESIAEICLERRLVICSDEIHCDLVYPGFLHTPIATLGPEVAKQTITLMAPSKTYNLAGLSCGFAVISDPILQERWRRAARGRIPSMNVFGQTAALAGYRGAQEWLNQVLAYLRGNRDFLTEYVADRLPGIGMTRMEGTYLAWLDCRETGLEKPFHFFLKEAKVALVEGREFGRGGEGFVRLNFACPRKTLEEALERMSAALKRI